MQLTRLFKYGCLVIFLPAVLQAQYVGSGRPWTAAQSRDSLAEVNSRITADSTRSDSIRGAIADSVRENTAQISSARGLNLDLNYYFDRSVVQITQTGNYTDWGDYNTATHSDNTTEYKTDGQSIKVTGGGGGYDGAYFDFTDIDLARAADQDTAGDWYICFAAHIPTNFLDSLESGGLLFYFSSTDYPTYVSNNFSASTVKASLSEGWNHIKIAKSAWSAQGGDWGDIRWFIIVGNATNHKFQFSIDNIQMVRRDAEAARPNPFQRETMEGIWVNEWDVANAKNCWIVEESGVLAYMTPEGGGITSYIMAGRNFEDYNISGKVKISSSGATNIFVYDNAVGYEGQFYHLSDSIHLEDSSGTLHSTAFTAGAGNEVFWRYQRRGTTVTASASNDGINWTSLSATGKAGLKTPTLYMGYDERMYELALSAVEHAHHATVTDGFSVPLGNIGRWHNGGVLEIYIKPDSSYFTPGDTVRAR